MLTIRPGQRPPELLCEEHWSRVPAFKRSAALLALTGLAATFGMRPAELREQPACCRFAESPRFKHLLSEPPAYVEPYLP